MTPPDHQVTIVLNRRNGQWSGAIVSTRAELEPLITGNTPKELTRQLRALADILEENENR